jgi:glucose/arabinose dehydrogenase
MKKLSHLLLSSVFLLLLFLLPKSAHAQIMDQPGFQQTTVITGLELPTAVRFAPNGKVFVAEKNGIIKVFDNINDTTATVFADLSSKVYTLRDHGLNGLAVDPDYPTRPYIYVAYSLQGNPGGRISRLTANGDVMTAGSEKVLVEGWCTIYGSHSMGDLRFGADKTLYASAGEGASFDFVDSGQTPDDDACNDPTNEGGALRSQDLRTTGDPHGLSGSIIRIDRDTGAALANNPLMGGRTDDDRIIAYGLRNPFRFYINETNNQLFIGDVGWNTWEEINHITNPVDTTVENFGWPCYEGVGRQPGYDAANLPICEGLYTAATGATSPYYTYNRAGLGGSISAITMYKGTSNYPTTYNNAIFFGDYAQEFIKVMLPKADGTPDPTSIIPFISDINVVDLQAGPNGDLYAAHIGTGTIHRISYFAGNTPPTAVLTADKTTGPLPLTVNFSGAGSSDPNSDPITYTWDLNGDGIFGDATGPTAQRTYTVKGTYTVTLKVVDSHGAEGIDTETIVAGNDAPVATISTPTTTLRYKVGDSITFSGSATDADASTLFTTYTAGAHPDAFNKVEKYWGFGPGATYPYAGKSGVGRGSDLNETNAPSPLGVSDMQMHPPDSKRLTVAAFTVPQTGSYRITNLGVRRVDPTTGQTSRFKVFNKAGTLIANLQTTSQAWVRNTNTFNLGTLNAGDKVYFTVDADGAFYYDATEIMWRMTRVAANTANNKVWDSHNVITQAGSPQASVRDNANTVTANIQLYESANDGGVTLGSGTLPASALTWDLILHHCAVGNPNDCHAHPVQKFTGVASGSFVAPDHEYPSHLELKLTATDQAGLTDTESRIISPQTTTLTFQSNPLGLQLVIYGTPGTTPFTREVIVNAKTTISAPTPQTLNGTSYTFTSWSDGGTQSHEITAPATATTYTATYSPGTQPTTSTWQSHNVVTQAGSPQGRVTDANGANAASVEFYESTNVGGVDLGTLFSTYNAVIHPDTFNKVENYWGNAAGVTYPYVGKSTVGRGADLNELNAPSPTGVRDLQLHPSDTDRLTVAAFVVPTSGTYSVSNLAVRRVDGNAGQTVRFKVFNPAKTIIANLLANSQSWATDAGAYNLGTLAAGTRIYFTIDRDGAYYWDAAEIAWTVTKQ